MTETTTKRLRRDDHQTLVTSRATFIKSVLSLIRLDTRLDEPHDFLRGCLYGVLFSLPLWGVIAYIIYKAVWG